jgi:hypothetical protein
MCVSNLFVHPTRPAFGRGRLVLIEDNVNALVNKTIRERKNAICVFR